MKALQEPVSGHYSRSLTASVEHRFGSSQNIRLLLCRDW